MNLAPASDHATPRARRVAPASLVTVAVGLSLGGVGCSNAGLVAHYQTLRPAMARGDWSTAAAQMEKAKENPYGEKDRVMYWLNLGTALHYAQAFDQSQANLVKAEEAMQDLWTKSISAEASKLFVNETAQSYPGEDFEQVLVYLYTALNQAQAGKLQDALVEARRADEKLKKMLVVFDKEGGLGTVYRQDAFMLWVIGLLYELEGSYNDAFITYRAAQQAYAQEYMGKFGAPAPSFLAEDLLRTATLAGMAQDAADARAAGARGDTAAMLKTHGELIVVHGNGEAPSKRELFFDGRMPDGYVMRIAVPQFVYTAPRTAYADVTVDGVSARTELAEPVAPIVLKNFELRLPGIKARALARAITKYATTQVAKAAGGKDSTASAILGLIGNIAAVVTEAADLRSWCMLPSEFRVARIWLPPGTHAVQVEYRDASGRSVGPAQTINVELNAGQRRLVSVRSVL